MLSDDELLEAMSESRGDKPMTFMRLERRFREKLQNQLAALGTNPSRTLSNTLYVDYINQTVATAQALGIDLSKPLTVYHGNSSDLSDTFKDFVAAVDAIIIAVRIQQTEHTLTYSVHLTPEEKVKIHHLCEQIRRIIEASAAKDAKRETLLNALNRFLAEVDRDRTRLEIIGSVMVSCATYVGDSAEKLRPLVDGIAKILGNAQDEEQKRLPPPDKRLPAPPKRLPAPDSKSAS